MGTIAGNARAVFDRFRANFEKANRSSRWTIRFKDDDEVLTWAETKSALDLLTHKGLIHQNADQTYQLTEAGVDVCVDPESLDDYIPRPGS